MALLEQLTPGARVRGILVNDVAVVVSSRWFGSGAVELTYKDSHGVAHSNIFYRDQEHTLEVVDGGRAWSFDGDGQALRLAYEAYRIKLAHLFDPMLAVHTSLVRPLPHQITAVYSDMLTRQPLRFLLADDPGAGKTIMTGLLIKELMARGDLKRCMIVSPGVLVEQWQDELAEKFKLDFRILTNEDVHASRSGNPFEDNHLLIVRLDKLSRNEELQDKLANTDWDLIVVDEAHKLSASYFGGEVKKTLRYKLGEKLSAVARQFLLLTATPHNGKEADFQLFLGLLDGDRFEGKFREGVHTTNTQDLMRRMVKEELVTFEGTPLFPERRAYPLTYTLSEDEDTLYKRVTAYVREEFNRADNLDGQRKGTVGFALTSLQRRLASSPEAIYQSLRRRRERLERRLNEEVLNPDALARPYPKTLGAEDWEDYDEAPETEQEEIEATILDEATARQTSEELRAEIQTLSELEAMADKVRRGNQDAKWRELSSLLQGQAEMFDAHGHRRKLVIFSEHRDTLSYLAEKIRTLLGRPEQVVIRIAATARPTERPEEPLSTHPQYMGTPRYGLTSFGDLFTDRQLVALNTLCDLIPEAQAKAMSDALSAKMPSGGLRLADGGSGAKAYGEAVGVYLSLGLSRVTDIGNALCRWENTKTQVRNLFARQALSMLWDYAETNIFGDAAGGKRSWVDWWTKAFKLGPLGLCAQS